MYKKGDLLVVSMMGDSKNAIAVEDSKNGLTRVNIEYNDVIHKGAKSITIGISNELLTERK